LQLASGCRVAGMCECAHKFVAIRDNSCPRMQRRTAGESESTRSVLSNLSGLALCGDQKGITIGGAFSPTKETHAQAENRSNTGNRGRFDRPRRELAELARALCRGSYRRNGPARSLERHRKHRLEGEVPRTRHIIADRLGRSRVRDVATRRRCRGFYIPPIR